MILRRIIEHVKAQNWTAVVLDFAIVVVGVFIGIQVSNWNAARESREQSAEFAARLTAELEVEAWQYAYVVEYYDDVLAHAERALAILEGTSDGDDEELLISAYRATQFNQNNRRRATFDELISAGAIGLIRDPALRNTAMNVYSTPIFKEVYETVSITPYRELFRSEISAAVQDALLAECGDKYVSTHEYDTIIDSLDYACELGLPADTIRTATDTIRDNEAFLRTLRLHRTNLKTQMDLLTRWYPEIREELGKFRRVEN